MPGMNCPVCGKDDKTIIQEARLALYRCDNCSHVFSVVDDENKETYNEDYFRKTHKNWFANPNYRIFDFVWSQILKVRDEADIRLFDVGCGKGDFLKYILTKTSRARLSGIDLTENEYPGIHFIKGDILKDEIDGTFNVISGFLVIEHIGDLRLFLKKIRDLLEPDGVVIFSTVNNDSLMYKLARLLNKIGMKQVHDRLYSSHHLQHYTNRSLLLAMEMNGLDAVLQVNHNYSLKAVDFPECSSFVKGMYMFAALIIFSISRLLGNGVLQTIICVKKEAVIWPT